VLTVCCRSDDAAARGCALARFAWRYLTETRRLPDPVLQAAADQHVVREGYRGSARFAHRADCAVSHIEVRGPTFKGSLTGGRKTLFRFGREGQGCRRLVITEAPIDALSEPPVTLPIGGIGLAEQDCALMLSEVACRGMFSNRNRRPARGPEAREARTRVGARCAVCHG